jgi:hypothetical protein
MRGMGLSALKQPQDVDEHSRPLDVAFLNRFAPHSHTSGIRRPVTINRRACGNTHE